MTEACAVVGILIVGYIPHIHNNKGYPSHIVVEATPQHYSTTSTFGSSAALSSTSQPADKQSRHNSAPIHDASHWVQVVETARGAQQGADHAVVELGGSPQRPKSHAHHAQQAKYRHDADNDRVHLRVEHLGVLPMFVWWRGGGEGWEGGKKRRNKGWEQAKILSIMRELIRSSTRGKRLERPQCISNLLLPQRRGKGVVVLHTVWVDPHRHPY
jgi:hypothetical protein